jgi:hypothetical protein
LSSVHDSKRSAYDNPPRSKYNAEEISKSILDVDRNFAEYKLKFKEKLANNW